MSVRSTLEQRLERLVAAGLSGPRGRAIRGRTPSILLGRILAEVAETILPRRLYFENVGGSIVVLNAANSRIMGVYMTEGLTNKQMAQAEMLGEIDGGYDDTRETLRQVLVALVTGTDALFVRQEPLEQSLDPNRVGDLASTLAEVWDIPLEPLDAEEAGAAVDSFLSASQEHILAWLMTGLNTEDSEGAGDDARYESLSEFAKSRRSSGAAERQSKLRDAGSWSMLVAVTEADPSFAIAVISIDDLLLYLAIETGSIGIIADAWREAVRA